MPQRGIQRIRIVIEGGLLKIAECNTASLAEKSGCGVVQWLLVEHPLALVNTKEVFRVQVE